MKSTLALAAAAASSLFATGCIVVGDTVDPGDPLDAHLLLEWETVESFTNVALDCYSVGADTVRVTARNSSTGKTYVDLFNCDDLAGVTYPLTAGDYYVNVDLASCGPEPDCPFPVILSAASMVGPIGVWDDADYDLGLFIFLVD